MLKSTQPPAVAQKAWPAVGQRQVPAVQVSVGLQARPQAPQFCASLWRLKQALEQLVCPMLHSVVQRVTLPVVEHTWPVGHAAPHMPQLRGSAARLTHPTLAPQ